MAYKAFKNTYVRSQAPAQPDVDKQYLDQELRKLERALKELTDQIKVLQSLVPNP